MFKSLRKKLSKFEEELGAELESELARELEADTCGVAAPAAKPAEQAAQFPVVEEAAKAGEPQVSAQKESDALKAGEPLESSRKEDEPPAAWAPGEPQGTPIFTEPLADREPPAAPVEREPDVKEIPVQPAAHPAASGTVRIPREVRFIEPTPAQSTPQPQQQKPAFHQPRPERKRAGRKVYDEHIESALEAELRHAVSAQRVAEKFVSTVEKKGLSISDSKLSELLWDLEIGLLESDVALPVIDAIKENVKLYLETAPLGKKDTGSIVETVLRNAIRGVLATSRLDFDEMVDKSDKPFVVMFVGVNGTGKTTSIAKIAHRLLKRGNSCVLAAGDTFRAGAIEQLETHANRLGVKIIKHSAGSDPAAVAYDAIEHAKARHRDVVLLDTAGRMQTNINLMDEMDKIKRVAKPDLILFVGDSLAGNDAVEQAKQFNQVVGIDGVILTKVDADAKGGAALSVAYTIGKPLVFIGVGQGYEDQIPFDPDWMVDRLFSGEE
ncbi:MAG: signal recognition particle-docking protein FtsY [Thermoplasmata archaeon HGW-Thermoplasmata-1]|nr:MAG: signal recognition particle-docking protein FtsY [Thermoplasmata archaeon HGW-Thermoplasmata-1]